MRKKRFKLAIKPIMDLLPIEHGMKELFKKASFVNNSVISIDIKDPDNGYTLLLVEKDNTLPADKNVRIHYTTRFYEKGLTIEQAKSFSLAMQAAIKVANELNEDKEQLHKNIKAKARKK